MRFSDTRSYSYCCIYLLLLLSLLINHSSAQESTITYTVSAPASTPSTYLLPTLFESSILNSTNTFRYQHSAPAIIWNTTLASTSQLYSSQCHFSHSGTPNVGENLAEGYPDVTSAVDGWGDERYQYSWNDPGFSEQTGHFTQLVWKDTTSTGCGVTNCSGTNGVGGWLLVCQYWPAGNVVGTGSVEDEYFVSNVGTQVTTAQMPSGWEETATPTSTTTSSASSTATESGEGGVSVTAVTTAPTATVTVGMSSHGNTLHVQTERTWKTGVSAVAVGFTAVLFALGLI